MLNKGEGQRAVAGHVAICAAREKLVGEQPVRIGNAASFAAHLIDVAKDRSDEPVFWVSLYRNKQPSRIELRSASASNNLENRFRKHVSISVLYAARLLVPNPGDQHLAGQELETQLKKIVVACLQLEELILPFIENYASDIWTVSAHRKSIEQWSLPFDIEPILSAL